MSEAPRTEVPAETEWVGRRVIGCAIAVHRELGPGFKESIYQRALCLELDLQGLAYESEKSILVSYKQWEIPGQRLDLVVSACLLVEMKAVPRLRPIHSRQVVSYLKAADLRLGFLINFDVPVLMPHGFKRIIV